MSAIIQNCIIKQQIATTTVEEKFHLWRWCEVTSRPVINLINSDCLDQHFQFHISKLKKVFNDNLKNIERYFVLTGRIKIVLFSG